MASKRQRLIFTDHLDLHLELHAALALGHFFDFRHEVQDLACRGSAFVDEEVPVNLRHHDLAGASAFESQVIHELTCTAELRIFKHAACAGSDGLAGAALHAAGFQTGVDLRHRGWFALQNGTDDVALFKLGDAAILMLDLAEWLLLNATIRRDEPHAHQIIRHLHAHRARVHADGSAEIPRHSFHPFQAADSGIPCRTGDLLQACANSANELPIHHTHLFKLALARMNDRAANAAVFDEQIRAATDHSNRHAGIGLPCRETSASSV